MAHRIQLPEDEGSYYPLGGDSSGLADDDSDQRILKQLGYKQELSRNLSALANFSMTFSVVSILTGLTTLYGTGLTYGGPATMVYGWLLVACFTMVVGVAMAEICSAYPTSGGLYFWSARLCGTEWGPFASWLTGCIQGAGWLSLVAAWASDFFCDWTMQAWAILYYAIHLLLGHSITFLVDWFDEFTHTNVPTTR